MSKTIVILRFRDLVVPTPGHTISEHTGLIKQFGYTWWGWWKKQAEKVPEATWSNLIREVEANRIGDLYLLDSGQRKLYKAELLDVTYAPGKDEAPVPENGEKTPKYYGESKDGSQIRFASWFKIRNITEVAETALHELAFAVLPHDDFAQVAPKEIIDRRIDKVANLLRFGNVTYWVGKPATGESKPAGQVRFLYPSAIAPEDVIVAQSPIILHLSDLHYSRDHHAFQMGQDDDHNPSLGRSIKSSLLGISPLLMPGVVVITGDLTWTGSAEEFDAAFDDLDALRSQLGLTRQHFVIIPGNHDLGWTRATDTAGAWNGRYEMASAAAKASYEAFFRRWYGTEPDEHLRIGRRFFLRGGPTTDIVGFNSSSLQQTKDEFQGMGRIPDAHYDEAARLMGWCDSRSPVTRRLVLTHHHLLPVVFVEDPKLSKRGFGIALDAAQQLRLAAHHKVDVVLHGHQHHPFAGYFRSVSFEGEGDVGAGVLILGGGSAGVKDEDLGPIHHRSYGLVHLEDRGTTYRLYATSEAPTRFDHKATIHTDGSGWARIPQK